MNSLILRKLWIVAFSLEAFVILSTNIISLVIFVRKYRHLKTSILLINLCIGDLLAGAFSVKLIIMLHTTDASMTSISSSCSGQNFLSILSDFSHIGGFESIVTLALIAVERAFAIIKPLRHRVAKRRYYRCGVLLTWCLTCIPTLITLVSRCNKRIIDIAFVFSFVVVIVTLFVMIVSYAAIYIKLRFYPVFQHNTSTQIQMRLLKTLFIATVASIGTTLPLGANYVYILSCKGCKLNNNVLNATLFLCLFNSFINFLIYAWKMPEFGKEMKNLIYFCRKTTLNEQLTLATRERSVAFTAIGRQVQSNKVLNAVPSNQ